MGAGAGAAGGLIGAEDEDVRDRSVIRGDLLGIFKDGGWSFGIEATKGHIVVFGVVGKGLFRGGRHCGLFGLLECLREGGLTGARSSTIRANLRPTFAEEVA